MKLTDLDAPSIASLPADSDSDSADSIRIARLSRKRAGAVTGSLPGMGPQTAAGQAAMTKPAPVRFVAAPPSRPRVNTRAAVLVALVMAASLWVLLDTGPASRSSPPRPKPALPLSPTEQRAAAWGRVRADAIAQARRDRGTDAELQDTIPVATPPPIESVPALITAGTRSRH